MSEASGTIRDMTNTPIAPQVTPEQPQPAVPVQAVAKEKNTPGLIALIVAVVGFIFACIPGALLVGWILLPIAFILALVSLFMKGKGKGFGVTALILSVVGTIVGVIVFFSVAVASIDEAFSGGETTVTAPKEAEAVTEEEPAEETVSDEGTRTNPYPLGTAITQGDWTVTVNSVTLDATEAITAENTFNDAPTDGTQYLMANVTATYNGDNADGEMPMLTVEYVTADGNTINSYDKAVIPPEQLDSLSTLYTGASTTGNVAFGIPAATAGEGTLAIRPSMLGDKAFSAVQ